MATWTPTKGRVRMARQHCEHAFAKLHRISALQESDLDVPEDVIGDALFNLRQALCVFEGRDGDMPANVIEMTAKRGRDAIAAMRNAIADGSRMPETALADAVVADLVAPGGFLDPDALLDVKSINGERPNLSTDGDSAA